MRLLLLLFMLCMSAVAQAQQLPTSEAEAQQRKFDLAYRYLNGLYVDSVDSGPLVEEAIRGMLSALDPHSAYLSAEEMKGVQESFDGEFSGIGIEFNVLRDTLIVVNTTAGGPASKVGLRPNDRIVQIDTLPAVGIQRADVPKYLRGKAGSKVDIEVVRHGEAKRLHFTIVRDKIPLNTVDAAYLIAPNMGYIKVNRFGRTTMDEFQKAFRSLGRVDALLLDLRGNSGGLLEQGIAMANFFLPKGAAIVSTEGRAVPSVTIDARADGEFTTGRLAVLVDEGSASASEIVAGAVQDWDRGVIIGRPSFGKGLVQRQMALPDGSAMRITIARYHTPSGRAIQRPYEKGKRDQYYMDHYKRFGERTDTTTTHKGDTLIYKTLRTGRTVYGGGGITPDLLTPIDTTGITPYFVSLARKGLVNEYTVSFVDARREELTRSYPTADEFIARFEADDAMLAEVADLGRERGVEFSEVEFAQSKSLLTMQIKALIAQKLFGLAASYRIVNEADDVMYKRAVEVLSDWKKLGAPLLVVN